MMEAVKHIVAALEDLPARAGEGPQTRKAMPHQQISQNAPPPLQEALFLRASSLPGVRTGSSNVSVPGARAFLLDPALAKGSAEAFIVGLEFAHLHPAYDGSLHLVLPAEAARIVIEKGWAELHPMAGMMGLSSSMPLMVYGPRQDAELEAVWCILTASYTFARGQEADGDKE